MTSFAADAEVDAVRKALLSMDPDGQRIGRVLRDTFDQLYDGQRTGRYYWDRLYKTEKTHCGTLVEINLQREFRFSDGITLDYEIAGAEVDCKYSQSPNGWMIPPEAHGHICILLSAEDTSSPTWSLGLLRVRSELLGAVNRDGKSKLNADGRNAVSWVFTAKPLPANVLLQLDPAKVESMMKLKSGRRKLNELFRIARGRLVGRAAVATVAQQHDYMRRIRANGGSRTDLKSEGIILLGQYSSHASIAKSLGVPVPTHGETISIRVAPATSPGMGVAIIDNGYWRVAEEKDAVVVAPELPDV